MHDSRPDLKHRARTMRRVLTREEQKLWRWLRDRRFGNYKFRRQYPIGVYVLDFYCHALKLAIEIDGGQHDYQRQYDDRRTTELQGYGIDVVRFTNREVRQQPTIVAQRIEYAIALAATARPSPGATRLPSPGGRGR